MAEEPVDPEPDVSEEDLVAYLDGEADDRTSQQIEQLLASDPRVRKTLHRLEKTWDLLDSLDGAEVDGSFTQSTLEIVAMAASEEVSRRQAEVARRRWRQWFLGVAGILAASLAGFFSVILLRPDPDRQLLADLPILENLTEYQQVEDFEFLKMLHDEGLFSDEWYGEATTEADPPESDCLPTGATPARLRQWVEQLSPTHRVELLHAEQRLAALDPDEQQRLRALSRQVERSPDGTELRRVLRRYHRWLTRLPLYRRAELVEAPSQERIQRIRQMREEEEERALARPNPADTRPLLEWIRQFAARHEAEILAALPEERREEVAKATPEHRRHLVTSLLWAHRGPTGQKAAPPQPTPEEMAEVFALLSPQTQRRLAKRSPETQWRLISGWGRYVVHYQGDIQRFGAPFPEASEAELVHFFEFELTPQQRDYLLGLPGDEMRRQLRRMYFRIKLPRPSPRPVPGNGTSGAAPPKKASEGSPTQPAPKQPKPKPVTKPSG